MTNFDWLNTITPIQHKEWHNEQVIRIWDIENYEFYDKEKGYTTQINPKQIKGIDYAYAYNCNSDITWKELLNQLKRFRDIRNNFSSIEELIEHAHNDYNESKAVMKYGDTLITITGQHRMALAKFLEIPSIKTYVIEHIFNHERYAKYLARKKYVEIFKKYGLLDERTKVDYLNCIEPWIFVYIHENLCCIEEPILDGFIDFFERIKTKGKFAAWRLKFESFFNPDKQYNLKVSNKSDFFLVRYIIRKHKSVHSI